MASCPSCQSTNVRKLSVVYEEGLSTIDLSSATKTVGAGVSPSGLGVGIAKSHGVTAGIQQTELSKKATPPPFTPLKLPPEPSLGTPPKPKDPGESAMSYGFLLGLSSPVVWLFWAFPYAFIVLVAGSLVYFGGNLRKRNMTEAEHEASRKSMAVYAQQSQELKLKYEKLHQEWEQDCASAKKYYERNNPLEIWKRSYMCMACGHKFDPTK